MSLNERIDFRVITAVGTLDFTRGKPSFYDAPFRFQLEGTGNFEGSVLGSFLDPGSAAYFHDITSLIFGAATFTQAKKGASYFMTLPFENIRFNITSLQAANSLCIGGAWT
jgi:hypothetical protein